jgi:hypothetical protein
MSINTEYKYHQLLFAWTGQLANAFSVRHDFPKVKYFKVKSATVYDPSGTLSPGTVYIGSHTLGGKTRSYSSIGGSCSGTAVIASLPSCYCKADTSLFSCYDSDSNSWMHISDEGEPIRIVDAFLLDSQLQNLTYLPAPVINSLNINVTIAFLTTQH